MKKKKILFLSLIIILGLTAVLLVYWKEEAQNIREKVLSSLKKNLKFCEISKDNINIVSRRGEFWLICNRRPFYATYEDDIVQTELNGWSFLKKDKNLWNELKNCDFYDSRNSELIFYCPYNFSAKPLAKFYKFDPSVFKITKIKEENFETVISDDIKQNYPQLGECTLSNFSGGGGRGYSPFADTTFNCEDYHYVVKTNFGFLVPPILIKPELEDKERAKLAFEKSFDTNPIVVDSTASYQFDSCKLSIAYPPLTNLNQVGLKIQPTGQDNESIKNVLTEIGKYFLFPPVDIKHLKFVSQETNKLYYSLNGAMVEVVEFGDNNIIIQRVGERYYENK